MKKNISDENTSYNTHHPHIPNLIYVVLFTASHAGMQGMPGALSDRLRHSIGFICELAIQNIT
jgi:hypothetical protein